MNLLHVFPSFQTGGSQRRFAALANHFGSRFTHTIVSLDGCRDAGALLGPSVPYTFAEAPPKAGPLTTILGARRRLRDLRPDLLVTYNWGAMEWAAANNGQVRHIHIEDGFGPEEAQRQLRRRVWFRRLVLNRHSTLVLPSQTLMRIARDEWKIAPARVRYVPNGIPCARFASPGRSRRDEFKGDGPVIGTVAALRREKALDRLIEAFARVREQGPARLVIVGDGPERSGLEARAADLGLSDSVTFTGALTQPEQAVAGFDLFAISSDTEQMPLSVLEAMAGGLAVAATDVGDIRTMVAPNNGAFVVPKDSGALAAAIQALLDDDHLRDRIGQANRDRACDVFDESRMFAAYEELFLGPQTRAAARMPLAADDALPAGE
jgi:glycosyltransferase involved in cell wall biosynthesis